MGTNLTQKYNFKSRLLSLSDKKSQGLTGFDRL